MTAAKGPASDHVAFLLRLTLLRLRAEATAAVDDPDALELTASQFRLLDQLPPEGARVTDIALRDRITKQALGQLAGQLADRGYVEIVPDPADGRARVIRRTTRGDRVRQAARAAMTLVEARWRDEVGEDRYAIFRDVLRELGLHATEE
jgi:DNA-binding MarR family transcriptional regulator